MQYHIELLNNRWLHFNSWSLGWPTLVTLILDPVYYYSFLFILLDSHKRIFLSVLSLIFWYSYAQPNYIRAERITTVNQWKSMHLLNNARDGLPNLPQIWRPYRFARQLIWRRSLGKRRLQITIFSSNIHPRIPLAGSIEELLMKNWGIQMRLFMTLPKRSSWTQTMSMLVSIPIEVADWRYSHRSYNPDSLTPH